MGSCCSNQEGYDTNKTIDTITTNEPLVKKNNFDPNLRKVDNEDIIFQKIDVNASSSDSIDTKELDNMMKTDDEVEDVGDDIDENDVDDNENIEEEEEQN
ncbi:hypothetical protein M9Y10_028044 [Tritrichomonas musculus]|uniref:Uncharacterized protein n=1 Tax=Tritrichomonas musculus TaxID=1915356 RepID=A0ABR2KI84_9EUKA